MKFYIPFAWDGGNGNRYTGVSVTNECEALDDASNMVGKRKFVITLDIQEPVAPKVTTTVKEL